jgi:plasmid stabilization system protein ParE
MLGGATTDRLHLTSSLKSSREAFATIEVAPEAGSRYPHPHLKGIRRIHLRGTRHHVYYLVGSEALVVLAVWGSVKGSGPDLKDIE